MSHSSIWLLYFVNAFQSAILNSLLPFVTSDFESHSLLTVIYIVANAISAACFIPLSKILDLWGRAEGFLIMATFATLGLIMMAACENLPTFCAAYVSLQLPASCPPCGPAMIFVDKPLCPRSSIASASAA